MGIIKNARRATVALAAFGVGAGLGVGVPSASALPECTSYNHRSVKGREITLLKCLGEPGANGRIMWQAWLSDARNDEVVSIRYRGRDGYIQAVAVTNDFSAATGKFYGNLNELQACAYLYDDKFYCAWTYQDS